MMSMGYIKTGFNVATEGMELKFDQTSQQQFLNCHFAVQISIPQLLQELARFQHAEAVPAKPRMPSVQDVSNVPPATVGANSCSGGIASMPRPPAQTSACAAMPHSAPGSAVMPPSTASLGSGGQIQRSVVGLPAPKQQPSLSPPPGVIGTSGIFSQTSDTPQMQAKSSAPMVSSSTWSSQVGATAPHSGSQDASAAKSALSQPGPAGASATLSAPSLGTTALSVVALQKPAIVPVGPAMPAILDTSASEDLVDAVLQGNVADAHLAISRGADVKMQQISGGAHGSLLHAAIERSGRVDMVNLLVQARCDVNAPASDGRTPLHAAVSRSGQISPLVTRLLLSMRADLHAASTASAGGSGAKPLDAIKAMAKESGRESSSTRQLMEEASEGPTVGIGTVDNEKVLGACFADAYNDKIVFYTESLVGFYGIDKGRVFLKQRLSQQRVQSVIRDMYVNPVLGTIGVFIEVSKAGAGSGSNVQNLIIIWPSGQLQEEEPLKISVDSGLVEGSLPPALVGSTSDGALTLAGRICGGKVLCWNFNSACSQLVSERQIVDRGGLVSISSDGCWVAVMNLSGDDNSQLEVWNLSGPRKADRIARLAKRPQSLVIMQAQEKPPRRGADAGCGSVVARIALAEAASADLPVFCIEVIMVYDDGSSASAYRIRADSPCRSLRFCHGSSDMILSAHADGLVMLCDLLSGQLRV
eukprot:CAMPEP_0115266182 /NCGR_PEP_ID=MMETSP0270-20121206/51334_1 /TAXON_ID=71861 /ORGANISM="Scrippsiella trochoidea, Strain CCMP3099" /LENGTH=700 /DNA_ID=CAMNT_0002682267 /DNA_START=69 /DNA_END=2168 /DNA_ORIENTATION=-